LRRKALIICLDGCGPEYIQGSDVPNIRKLCKDGYYVERGYSIVPTVTNVNNVSVITGAYPEEHGITTNFHYERSSRQEIYMESPDFIITETIFQMATERKLKCALLTSKDKLCALLSRGAQVAFSAESPPEWMVRKIGPPPHIYSIEVNVWLLKAGQAIIKELDPDLLYLATTDYAMHKYRPEDSESKQSMQLIDQCIGDLAKSFGDAEETLLCITADHGMSDKMKAVNLEAILREAGIKTKVLPTVKDKYMLHHSGLGGSAHVYLEDQGDMGKANDMILNTEGVEEVLDRGKAAERYHLHYDRTGDLFVLGKKDYVFGYVEGFDFLDVKIRSHGSLHEQKVPIIVYGGDSFKRNKITENRELGNLVIEHLELKK